MTDAWPTIRHFASAASLTTFAVGGAKTVLAGYQTFASPCTSLTESEKKLKRVRSQLQRLSPKRREEIEIAIRNNATDCKSLKDLEEQLDGCAVLLIDTVSLSNINSQLQSLVSWICSADSVCGMRNRRLRSATFRIRSFGIAFRSWNILPRRF